MTSPTVTDITTTELYIANRNKQTYPNQHQHTILLFIVGNSETIDVV